LDIAAPLNTENATVKEDLKNQLNVLSAIFENLEANSK
jgi:hypothetical protein